MCLKPEAVKAKAARLEKLRYYKASANTTKAAIATPQECYKASGFGPRQTHCSPGPFDRTHVPAGCAAHLILTTTISTLISSTRVRGDLSPVCLKPEAAKAARLEKLKYYKASEYQLRKGAAIATAFEKPRSPSFGPRQTHCSPGPFDRTQCTSRVAAHLILTTTISLISRAR